MSKYDVGIIGVWSGCNYGSIATYYALNQVISSMGKTVLMIDKPILSKNDVERNETHSRRFAREHYNISEQYSLNEMYKLNELCDAFVLGSDQVWNYGISKNFGKKFYLDFADDDKKKIAYAASFGHGIDFAPPEERVKISELMSRFDGISVREADGVRLCKDEYGIKAVQVLDPVFLADPKIYTPLIEKSKAHEDEPFLVTYILDPTPEKREAILHLSEKLGGIKIINMLDGLPWNFEKNRELMDLPNCIENLQVEDWLYYLSHAEYVITDSCHGASFAVIFKKRFTAITNKRRGFSRFKSLSQLLKFENKVVTDPKQILTDETLLQSIDYTLTDSIINEQRNRCQVFLQDMLNQPKKTDSELKKQNVIGVVKSEEKTSSLKSAEKKTNDESKEMSTDFNRCKMLVSLLRDYGIKHVVLSAGSRNLNLVRLFENNSCFKTYSVIDERSAGFFAIGLSLKLKETVAMCCTSGTAASNYLSSVTEAFYQGVPLVVITADRYPCLLGQNIDQTIPQANIFNNVVKKSVSLPVNEDYLGDWEARRMIEEAILEVNHHGSGPVHINIPIRDIERLPPPLSHFKLGKYRLIRRLTYSDSKTAWNERVEKLKKAKRIMVIYGQEAPLNDEEQRSIENFAEKFNCVILTDHLSNFKCSKSVDSYPILRNYNNQKFSEELGPDIVITIGGRRMLNDPLRPKLLSFRTPYEHWRISEDGKIADTFRRLNEVFECNQGYFFDYFTKNAGDIKNDQEYFRTWKKAEENLPNDDPKAYSQLYVVKNLIENIPKNSILHIGIGNSIMFANRYPIDSSVEVFCNMGTNGIDGSASTYMGHVAATERLAFLIISDLSFFYDMNSLWNKKMKSNIRILLVNNSGTSLLAHHRSPSITHKHNAVARDWVKSLGFTYLTSENKEEFDENIKRFVSDENVPMFFEAFTKFE